MRALYNGNSALENEVHLFTKVTLLENYSLCADIDELGSLVNHLTLLQIKPLQELEVSQNQIQNREAPVRSGNCLKLFSNQYHLSIVYSLSGRYLGFLNNLPHFLPLIYLCLQDVTDVVWESISLS